MTDNVLIRDETPHDVEAIAEVTLAAFRALEVSNQTEPLIIAALRSAGALTVSLVAELDGRVAGHVAFSPVTLSDGSTDWFALGPVAVLPDLQRRGIGSALIHEGLARLKARGAQGCCLVGHPEYYIRFGFTPHPGLTHEGVPPEVFLALPFDSHTPRASVHFHPAFAATPDQP